MLNGGSSSIRFAVYGAKARSQALLKGKVDRVGARDVKLLVAGREEQKIKARNSDLQCLGDCLVQWLGDQPIFEHVKAVGHRIVHGMSHAEPELVTPGLLAELRKISLYDPDHLPREIHLIKAVSNRSPKMKQIVCFDTAFHRTMPPVARRLPIPHRYTKGGVERYGFHGLSFAYLMEELARLDRATAKKRVILAHLGNGASLAAVRNERCADTTMAFTPAAGLMMGTRTGDLDPGLPYYFSRSHHMSPARFHQMVNGESGLLGVSGISADVRELEAREGNDPRAGEALELFCYQAKKHIGGLMAALGGLDVLVFSAGIGENSPRVRRQICENLEFLGIQLSAQRNAANAPVISTAKSKVIVRVIRTDEELMIARSVSRFLGFDRHGGK